MSHVSSKGLSALQCLMAALASNDCSCASLLTSQMGIPQWVVERHHLMVDTCEGPECTAGGFTSPSRQIRSA